MVHEVDEQFSMRVFDVAMKQPFVKVCEVDLTARLEAFNEEALYVVVEHCRVFLIDEAQEVRPSGEFAAIFRLRMNHQKFCQMNENSPDVFRV